MNDKPEKMDLSSQDVAEGGKLDFERQKHFKTLGVPFEVVVTADQV